MQFEPTKPEMSLLRNLFVICCVLAVSLGDVEVAGDGTEIALTETSPAVIIWNKYTIIAAATAAVLVVGGLAILTPFVLPVITYKLCYLIGRCGKDLEDDVDVFIAKDANPRSKRSIEYFGPILQTLAAAYEKYGEDPKKKLEKLKYFTK